MSELTDLADLAPGPLRAATALQTTASDPLLSAWVSANAGSGKTHVLARRVIRLLMRGVPPGRILCLTYTKAAAANMANRVLDELRKWATLDDDALDREIVRTDGGRPDAQRRAHARRLFAQALETPGGLKIQTIHAFCGALLHAFPFEAGVPAGFGELEEAARLELLARVRADVVLEAAGRPESALGQALGLIVGTTSDDGIDEIIGAMVADPTALEASDDDLAAAVGLAAPIASREIEHRIIAEALIVRGAWLGLGQALIEEGGNCARRGRSLLEAAAAPDEGAADAYARVFLKEDGEPYGDSQFGAAPIRDKYPLLLAERDRIAPLARLLSAARAFERSRAVLILGREAARRYERAKAARGVLDFSDLVNAARRLLASGASAWVHYKLDQGIDHVLLDEAQDTSPEQWEVIRPLVAEFFAGEGAHFGAQNLPRTLFVVGDEKQSIFSFQGADPRRFDTVRRELMRLTGGVGFEHIELRHSFRSAPGILAAVDTVFHAETAYQGLSALAEPPVHEAIHAALPSLVELWEPEAPSEKVDIDAWQRPLDAPAADDPKGRLARKIAGHIAARIREGFPVTGRHGTRPARPGDFLILVRRRDALFEAIIRELKEARVAVAGADRLTVAQHIAVMDLMALGDALLSRDDELALACALKSPLFGFDDADLMKLAPERTGLLEDALLARAGENPRWQAAAERLHRLRPEARRLRPFDFYARVLGRERGRAAMIARLGPEAADALDEMLALARSYENVEAPSLAGFLAFLRRGGAEAKRDMEAGRDEVRVMTVHGAKGLEAPYVILADTTSGPMTRRAAGLLRVELPDGRRAALHAPSKKNDTPAMAMARAQGDAAQQDEYRRLLYVALTRAESALVLAGADGGRKRPADCWYDLVRGALEPEAVEQPAAGFAGTVRRWRAAVQEATVAAPAVAAIAAAPDDAERALARALARPVEEPTARAALRPSASSLLSAAPEGPETLALRRGELLHRLMAALASLPAEERAAPGRRLLAAAGDFEEASREELLTEALGVLAVPGLADLFGPGSLAEVPLIGALEDGTPVSGRIDRLAVLDDRIVIADFKTDRRVPRDALSLPPAHVRQVALYARLLRLLYPGRPIEARLVYTAGPLAHALGADVLERIVESVTSQ